MSSFPEIKTKRLRLSKVSYLDIPQIVEYAGNLKIAKTTFNIPYPYKEEDAIFWINNASQGYRNKTQYTFGVRLQYSDEFIGGIGLKINMRFNHAELAYWIAEPFWGEGYGTEAVDSILKFGFMELNLHKIFAMHLAENPASGKVMIKNNMIKEGELVDHTKKGDSYKTLIQYRLTKEEYKIAGENI